MEISVIIYRLCICTGLNEKEVLEKVNLSGLHPEWLLKFLMQEARLPNVSEEQAIKKVGIDCVLELLKVIRSQKLDKFPKGGIGYR